MELNFSLMICLTSVIIPADTGSYSDCVANKTLLIPEGSSASLSTRWPRYRINLKKENSSGSYNIYYGHMRYHAIHFFDQWIESRTEIKIENMTVTTIIHDVVKADNGTYVFGVRSTICFALFVFGIDQQPTGKIEEHSPAYFKGYPEPSEVSQIVGSVEVKLFVDGKNYSQAPQYFLQKEAIWIASATRNLNGKNITYRALQANGSYFEANYTVEVKFGPEAPLLFTPNKAHYFLTSGDTMPDISCSVDCNPACIVSWDNYGTGNKLSLGKVTTATAGEYVCIASRSDENIFVNRSLTVHVADKSALKTAIAVLASIQTLISAMLGLLCISVYKRNNTLTCPSCSRELNSTRDVVKTTSSDHETDSGDETGNERYIELALGSGIITPTQRKRPVQNKGKPIEEGVYENTIIA